MGSKKRRKKREKIMWIILASLMILGMLLWLLAPLFRAY